MTPALDRRRFFALSAAAAAAGMAGRPARAGSPEAPSWSGYGSAIVIDALGGLDDGTGEEDAPLTAAELAEARASGVTAVNVTVSAVGVLEGSFEKTVKGIAAMESELDAHPDVLVRVRSVRDLEAAKASGRLGLIYGFQDTLPLGDELDRIELFHRLGVRIVQLTYNGRNLAGDGCLEPGNAGLSRLGREMVERFNARGMLVDLSHCGHRTTSDGIAASSKPVAITHSGCAALTDLPRNKTDEELRQLAAKGGVFGVYFMPFLRASGQPMAEDVIRHIEHAVKVAGEDHVGIGTDLSISAVSLTPEFKKKHREFIAERRRLKISAPGETDDVYLVIPDLNTPLRLDTLAGMLLARGHSPQRVSKILGGNFARLFSETWS